MTEFAVSEGLRRLANANLRAYWETHSSFLVPYPAMLLLGQVAFKDGLSAIEMSEYTGHNLRRVYREVYRARRVVAISRYKPPGSDGRNSVFRLGYRLPPSAIGDVGDGSPVSDVEGAAAPLPPLGGLLEVTIRQARLELTAEKLEEILELCHDVSSALVDTGAQMMNNLAPERDEDALRRFLRELHAGGVVGLRGRSAREKAARAALQRTSGVIAQMEREVALKGGFGAIDEMTKRGWQ